MSLKILWNNEKKKLCHSDILPGTNKNFQESTQQEKTRIINTKGQICCWIGEAGIFRITGKVIMMTI